MPKLKMPPLTLEANYIHPVLGGGLGPYSHAVLGEPGGLTQYGVHIEVLPPGSRSGYRHWHEAEDEFVYVISGSLVLVEDEEFPMTAGDAAAWPAGHPVGHYLENRSEENAVYLVAGSRYQRDVIHYPDDDLVTVKDGKTRQYRHRDGRPREVGSRER